MHIEQHHIHPQGKLHFFYYMAEMQSYLQPLDFYSPCPRTPVIYSEYGKTLFRELKQIRDIAKRNIQQAQKSQKKQYDKNSHPVTVEAGDTVFVKVQPKLKLIMDLIEFMKLQALM